MTDNAPPGAVLRSTLNERMGAEFIHKLVTISLVFFAFSVKWLFSTIFIAVGFYFYTRLCLHGCIFTGEKPTPRVSSAYFGKRNVSCVEVV